MTPQEHGPWCNWSLGRRKCPEQLGFRLKNYGGERKDRHRGGKFSVVSLARVIHVDIIGSDVCEHT